LLFRDQSIGARQMLDDPPGAVHSGISALKMRGIFVEALPQHSGGRFRNSAKPRSSLRKSEGRQRHEQRGHVGFVIHSRCSKLKAPPHSRDGAVVN
jgi:hypothetical protein